MTTASTLNAIAVYFIIWWTILFAILPFRVRSQQEVGGVSSRLVSRGEFACIRGGLCRPLVGSHPVDLAA
jgi:hypothetical protein